MGAGIVECDVTFTKDKELVCRHAQNDLHTTTNILVDAARRASAPALHAGGDRADGALITPASAECRTSEITLAEFKTLSGKMDAFNPARAHAQRVPGRHAELPHRPLLRPDAAAIC